MAVLVAGAGPILNPGGGTGGSGPSGDSLASELEAFVASKGGMFHTFGGEYSYSGAGLTGDNNLVRGSSIVSNKDRSGNGFTLERTSGNGKVDGNLIEDRDGLFLAGDAIYDAAVPFTGDDIYAIAVYRVESASDIISDQTLLDAGRVGVQSGSATDAVRMIFRSGTGDRWRVQRGNAFIETESQTRDDKITIMESFHTRSLWGITLNGRSPERNARTYPASYNIETIRVGGTLFSGSSKADGDLYGLIVLPYMPTEAERTMLRYMIDQVAADGYCQMPRHDIPEWQYIHDQALAGNFAGYYPIMEGYSVSTYTTNNLTPSGGARAGFINKAFFDRPDLSWRQWTEAGNSFASLNAEALASKHPLMQVTGTYEPFYHTTFEYANGYPYGTPPYYEGTPEDEGYWIPDSAEMRASTAHTFVIALKTSDDRFRILADRSNPSVRYAGFANTSQSYITENGFGGFDGLRIDGVEYPQITRDMLRRLLTDDRWHVVSFTGLNLSGIGGDLGILHSETGVDTDNFLGQVGYLAHFPDDEATLLAAEAHAMEARDIYREEIYAGQNDYANWTARATMFGATGSGDFVPTANDMTLSGQTGVALFAHSDLIPVTPGDPLLVTGRVTASTGSYNGLRWIDGNTDPGSASPASPEIWQSSDITGYFGAVITPGSSAVRLVLQSNTGSSVTIEDLKISRMVPPPPPGPDIAYSYGFDTPDPGYTYWFGQGMTWNTLGPGTPAGSASFYAGSSSGQTGGQYVEIDVDPGVEYTLKTRIPLTSNGAVWRVYDIALASVYATISGAAANVGDTEVTFTPTQDKVRLAISADWNNWAYIDEIAIFKTGTPAPF